MKGERVSRYRQEVYRVTAEMKELAMKAGYQDLLLGGVPVEVYRRCGKARCRCMASDEHRHGPYQVVQIYQDGRSWQLTLKKSEGKYFDMAKRYQYQVKNRAKLQQLGKKLLELFDGMIEARTVWNKK